MAVSSHSSAKKMLIEWFESEIDNPDELDINHLVGPALDRFKNDPEFQESVTEEFIRIVLPDLIRRFMAHNRKMLRAGQTFINPYRLEEQIGKRLNDWYEHVGGSVHKRLGAMKKPDLLYAANERREQAATQLAIANLHTRLAEGLPNNYVSVEEHYDKETFTTIWRETME